VTGDIDEVRLFRTGWLARSSGLDLLLSIVDPLQMIGLRNSQHKGSTALNSVLGIGATRRG
jgi:hypothetical protein